MSNFDTVREALMQLKEFGGHAYDEASEALTALAELERTHYTAEDVADASAQGFRDGVASLTAGQQPVGWFEPPHGAFRANPRLKMQLPPSTLNWQIPVYTAAPVAQQPRQCGLCGSDEAFTGTCGGGRRDPRALCYEPVAQQPQAEAVPPTHVLVPVEPTDAMLIAGGNDAEFCMCCGYDNGPGDCGSIWEAMIAAAQGEKP